MIVIADLHLHEDTAGTVFKQIFPHVLNEAIQQPDKTIAILGDFWHKRYYVPVHLQNEVVRWLEYCAWKDVTVILLPGNHDQINAAGANALEVFRPLARVYTNPVKDEYGLWIPYRKEFDTSLLEQNKYATLWLHQGVKGALMNENVKDIDGVPSALFESWRNVFAGHYHRQQQIGRVNYVGSPYQTRADEYGQNKGYGVWDAETGTMNWVHCLWGKRYHRVALVDESQLKLDGVDKKDDLRIKTAANIDVPQLSKALQDKGYTNVTIIPDQVVQEARLQVETGADIEGFIQAFVDQDQTHLDKKTLMTVCQDLLK